MNRFPRWSDFSEHKSHAAGSGFGCAFVVLRLRPEARYERSGLAEHRDVDVAHVELHVFDFRIGTLAVLAHLFPTLRDGAVVVEQIELRRVPVDVCDNLYVCLSDAVEELVEGGTYTFRTGRRSLLCLRRRRFSRYGRFGLSHSR